MRIFPEYDWLAWKFSQTPRHYWSDIKNQRKYLNWLATILNIKSKDDWYKLSVEVPL